MLDVVKKEGLSPEAIDLIASRFRILGEPLRIRILQALQAGELSVGQLTTRVGSTQPNVSKHLRILQESGFVGRRQEGNTVYCFVADPSVMDLCNIVCDSIEARLAAQAEKVRRFGVRQR